MKVLIVAGSHIDEEQLHALLLDSDYIIALDRGLEFLLAMDRKPDILLGDMDSLRLPIPGDLSVQHFPPEKGFSDLEAGLVYAQSLGAERITILGATGKRIDHLLSALSLLADMPEEVHILDKNNRIRRLKGKTTLRRENYPYFSIQPLGPIVLSIEGAKYDLQNKELSPVGSLLLSNEWRRDAVQLTLHSGRALLIESSD